MKGPEKVLTFGFLAAAGAAAGYIYLVRVLHPVRPVPACSPGVLSTLRCGTYAVIVSTPFFLAAGALMGAWLAYALVRLYTRPAQRSFTKLEGLMACPLVVITIGWIVSLRPDYAARPYGWFAWGWLVLGWYYVLLFILVAVLARLMIGIASVARIRGGLLLACGIPILLSGLGYAVLTAFPQPPEYTHSCSPGAPRWVCVYHPVIGEGGAWVLLGLLAGTWLAFAAATALTASPPSRTLRRAEVAIVAPVLAVVVSWAIVFGPQPVVSGAGYVGPFVACVAVTVLLRLLLGIGPVRRGMSAALARLGMISRPAATG